MRKVALLCAASLLASVGIWAATSARRPKYELGKMASAQALSEQATFSRLAIVNSANVTVAELGWREDDFGGLIHARNFNGATVVAIGSDSFGEGVVTIQDINQNPRAIAWVNGNNTGEFTVFNSGGNPTYSMKGDQGFVSWGGDIAEHFDASVESVPPGTVVVLDPAKPGAVVPSSSAYDRLVAGVVSGANSYNPGVTLGVNRESRERVPVTLTGTVYVRATNDNGVIEVGDLLVTSSVPGTAMKSTDYQAAQGAVLGKAMEKLGDTGLIKILVTLQ
jgi:hypothetical protein